MCLWKSSYDTFLYLWPFARAIPRSDLELELGRHVSVRYHQEENNGGPIRPQSAVHQRPTTTEGEERGRAEEEGEEGEGASRKRARSLSPPDAKVRLEEEEVEDGGEKEDKFAGAAASRRKR